MRTLMARVSLTVHNGVQARRGLLGGDARDAAPQATFASVASGGKVCQQFRDAASSRVSGFYSIG